MSAAINLSARISLYLLRGNVDVPILENFDTYSVTIFPISPVSSYRVNPDHIITDPANGVWGEVEGVVDLEEYEIVNEAVTDWDEEDYLETAPVYPPVDTWFYTELMERGIEQGNNIHDIISDSIKDAQHFSWLSLEVISPDPWVGSVWVSDIQKVDTSPQAVYRFTYQFLFRPISALKNPLPPGAFKPNLKPSSKLLLPFESLEEQWRGLPDELITEVAIHLALPEIDRLVLSPEIELDEDIYYHAVAKYYRLYFLPALRDYAGAHIPVSSLINWRDLLHFLEISPYDIEDLVMDKEIFSPATVDTRLPESHRRPLNLILFEQALAQGNVAAAKAFFFSSPNLLNYDNWRDFLIRSINAQVSHLRDVVDFLLSLPASIPELTPIPMPAGTPILPPNPGVTSVIPPVLVKGTRTINTLVKSILHADSMMDPQRESGMHIQAYSHINGDLCAQVKKIVIYAYFFSRSTGSPMVSKIINVIPIILLIQHIVGPDENESQLDVEPIVSSRRRVSLMLGQILLGNTSRDAYSDYPAERYGGYTEEETQIIRKMFESVRHIKDDIEFRGSPYRAAVIQIKASLNMWLNHLAQRHQYNPEAIQVINQIRL
jgi:hypothetical protein